jgi:hypothetical protein
MPILGRQDGRKHAQALHSALEAQLRAEDVRRNEKARMRFAAR